MQETTVKNRGLNQKEITQLVRDSNNWVYRVSYDDVNKNRYTRYIRLNKGRSIDKDTLTIYFQQQSPHLDIRHHIVVRKIEINSETGSYKLVEIDRDLIDFTRYRLLGKDLLGVSWNSISKQYIKKSTQEEQPHPAPLSF